MGWSAVEWVVLLQVAPRGCSPLDLWYFFNFGPLDIWARSETWPEIVLLIFLAIQGKIQGKKIVKLFWAITFDWGVLRTSGQRLWATFIMLFSGIPHLAMFIALSQIVKYPNIWLIWLFGCTQKTWPSGSSLKRALKTWRRAVYGCINLKWSWSVVQALLTEEPTPFFFGTGYSVTSINYRTAYRAKKKGLVQSLTPICTPQQYF